MERLLAINVCPAGEAGKACNYGQTNTDQALGSLVGTLIQAVFVIAIIVALAYLVYGAIRWIMSQGDKSKVADARNHIVAAIIGMVIVFMSYFIINVILQIFFGTSISSFNLPSGGVFK
jgi:hypothetical protein